MSPNIIPRTLGDFLTGLRMDRSPWQRPPIEYQPPALPQIDPQKTIHLCFQNVHSAHPSTVLQWTNGWKQCPKSRTFISDSVRLTPTWTLTLIKLVSVQLDWTWVAKRASSHNFFWLFNLNYFYRDEICVKNYKAFVDFFLVDYLAFACWILVLE